MRDVGIIQVVCLKKQFDVRKLFFKFIVMILFGIYSFFRVLTFKIYVGTSSVLPNFFFLLSFKNKLFLF